MVSLTTWSSLFGVWSLKSSKTLILVKQLNIDTNCLHDKLSNDLPCNNLANTRQCISLI